MDDMLFGMQRSECVSPVLDPARSTCSRSLSGTHARTHAYHSFGAGELAPRPRFPPCNTSAMPAGSSAPPSISSDGEATVPASCHDWRLIDCSECGPCLARKRRARATLDMASFSHTANVSRSAPLLTMMLALLLVPEVSREAGPGARGGEATAAPRCAAPKGTSVRARSARSQT